MKVYSRHIAQNMNEKIWAIWRLHIFILKFPDLYAKIECWPYYPGVVQAPVQMTLFQINSSKYCIQNNWGWKLQNLKKELIFVFTNIRKFWL